MEGDEEGLEVWTDTQPADDLVDDYSGPGGVGFEVDKEAEAEGCEEEAELDGFWVAACFADEEAYNDGAEGCCEDHGESVDAAEDWGGVEDGLEV